MFQSKVVIEYIKLNWLIKKLKITVTLYIIHAPLNKNK